MRASKTAALALMVLTCHVAVAAADDQAVTRQDLARIEVELKAQRVLLGGLLRLLQRRLAEEQAALEALRSEAAVSSGEGRSSTDPPARTPEPPEPSRPRKRASAPVGTVTGMVALRGARSAWVYVEDVQRPARRSAAMKQSDRAFVPGALVVTKGSNVAFPNVDPIFHNVFSATMGTTFDLGSYPQGESRTMTMTRTGQIDVFCNLHPQMRGYIFVVPNPLFVKVGDDGRFTLPKVPVGNRRIGVWAPGAAPVVKGVTIAKGQSARLDFELTAAPARPHARKDGSPYGSYDE
jgi:plastocyanin